MLVYFLALHLIVAGSWCADIEKMIVPQGHSFSFDCRDDESIYFARKLNEWSEVQENGDLHRHLNLNLNYPPKENILRVTSDSVESKHAGFYACRKPTWTSASMDVIYQLVLADVQSFYWNSVCHGPIGSCQRTDDLLDENRSEFEVADRTSVELFCCASITGYNNVDIRMNALGENYGSVEVARKQEPDGSAVICASQRTTLKQLPYKNQQTLKCDLLIDGQRHSSLFSVIKIKDALAQDLPSDSTLQFNPHPGHKHEYFIREPVGRSRRRLSKGKKIAILIGSIAGGLLLLGLTTFILMRLCRRKTITSSSTSTYAKKYAPVNTSEQPRYQIDRHQPDAEPIYEEPTVLSVTSPVVFRC